MFQGEKSSRSATSIRPSHLMFAIPTQPGTTSRAGAPWSGGSGSPFISYATSTSSNALPTGSGRRTWPWPVTSASRPSGMTSTARQLMPARSSSSPSGTPRQRATPIAPSFHCVPDAGVPCWMPKKLRPLPAHSMAAVIVRDGSRWRSRSENVLPSGLRSSLPNTFRRQVAGSMIGVAVWLRTMKRSFGIR